MTYAGPKRADHEQHKKKLILGKKGIKHATTSFETTQSLLSENAVLRTYPEVESQQIDFCFETRLTIQWGETHHRDREGESEDSQLPAKTP